MVGVSIPNCFFNSVSLQFIDRFSFTISILNLGSTGLECRTRPIYCGFRRDWVLGTVDSRPESLLSRSINVGRVYWGSLDEESRNWSYHEGSEGHLGKSSREKEDWHSSTELRKGDLQLDNSPIESGEYGDRLSSINYVQTTYLIYF